MKKIIDIDALLAPIPGGNPAGEDLRYSPTYDDLKEARRADDLLERGEWQREIKASDWTKVHSLAVEALSKKTKDLQIAVWLTEGLIKTQGFRGLADGLRILIGLMDAYWDKMYPPADDGDLDYRAAPLQLLNDKLSPCVKEIPLTDPRATAGYSWLKWQESAEVGAESDTLNRFGDTDESKKKRREELIAEGKLTAEEFASAVARTPADYSQELAEDLTLCRENFKKLDEVVDAKFGAKAPRLSDFGEALEECARAVMKLYKRTEKKSRPAPNSTQTVNQEEKGRKAEEPRPLAPMAAPAVTAIAPSRPYEVSPSDSGENSVWEEAVRIMNTSGIRASLARLLDISNCAPSVRARGRYRLLMAKICLEADRPDLARPIVEELNHLIEELHLERWESPAWIAEVLEALYQCLTRGEPSEEDLNRGKGLFQRLCTTDVTKAITYKG